MRFYRMGVKLERPILAGQKTFETLKLVSCVLFG